MVSPLGGRESIFLFSHTNEFCGTRKVAREPGLASGPQEIRRWVCERGDMAGRGPAQNRRVGKIKKVVNTRGGAVLFFTERFFFFSTVVPTGRNFFFSSGLYSGLYRGTIH
jgi:hypothetical protein